MVLRAKQDKLPLPAAIAPGTPMSDLTNAGDSFQTNAMVDNVLVARGASCDARRALRHRPRPEGSAALAGLRRLRGFPPTILTTGTRDLLLSNTVRVHRKLRQAGVEAVLQVYEGQSHAHYYRDVSAPETRRRSARSPSSSTSIWENSAGPRVTRAWKSRCQCAVAQRSVAGVPRRSRRQTPASRPRPPCGRRAPGRDR